MDTSKKKIIVADDDSAIVDSLQMMLELSDYEVRTTVDGTVLSLMKEEKPDLLLLDISMSGVDGRDICRTLKKDSQLQDVPVIMISASKDVRASSKDAGAEDFLAKPFEVDELLSKVKKHIDTVTLH